MNKMLITTSGQRRNIEIFWEMRFLLCQQYLIKYLHFADGSPNTQQQCINECLKGIIKPPAEAKLKE